MIVQQLDAFETMCQRFHWLTPPCSLGAMHSIRDTLRFRCHHLGIARCAPRPLPFSCFRQHSSGRRGLAISFLSSLRLVLIEKHVSLVCVQSPQQKVSPLEQYECNEAVQLLQTAHAGRLVERDGTG